jgi:hypothetical protein
VQQAAKSIYDKTSGTIASSPYPGSQVAPLSGDTLAAQNFMKQFANTSAPQLNQLMANATTFGLGDVLNPASNPGLQGSINAAVRPITESYTDPGGVFSQIRTGAIGDGGYGRNTRQGIAEGIAAGRYADAVGDATSKITNENYQAGLDTFTKVLGLSPSTEQAMLTPAQLQSSVGAQNETQQQLLNDYASQAKQWELNADWLPLQNWANIVYGGSSPGSTATSTGGNASRSSPLMGAMGGAMSGWALGSSIGSIGGPMGAIGGAILGGLFS